MKHIIIAGPSRAGKTTLARKIGEELGYFVISVDTLVAAFQGAYPQLDIRHNWDRERTTDNIAPFLGHFLGAFPSGRGAFILEGGYFNFDKIVPILKTYGIDNLRENFLLLGLAQNKKTADEIFSDIRKHDTDDDWTYFLDDDDLRDVAEDAVAFSRSMTEHLMKHGFTVYDTSMAREQVFEQIIKEIQSKVVQ